MVLDGQVNNGNEIGTVARIAFPNAALDGLTLLVGNLVVVVHLSLKLG